ncbi:MAG TPA: TerC/Alx family metal homeostasis membrane protein [Anaeromyxobacter sp.]|nr:TerC/Alx family metal homeostasis membrane protein [Anaeromyxobacter sp.]
MTPAGTLVLWASFLAVILLLLAIDLGVLNRKDREPSAGEALGWSAAWAALALLFAGFVAWRLGSVKALDFLTGYLIELSLSVDNLFVFALVFASLGIPEHLQHRVLFWGILGALVLRAAMIVGGVALVTRFTWLFYGFGAFLVVSGIRFLFRRGGEHHPERSWAFETLRRVVPATTRLYGHRFSVVEGGRRVATPLFLALLLVELADVVFALDSIPAILGVTQDPFIVFTSNIFAILGLRSLYFVLARLIRRFEYLHYGLAVVLVFIGAKMGLSRFVHLPSAVSLSVVVVTLSGAVGFSVLRARRGRGAPRGGGP